MRPVPGPNASAPSIEADTLAEARPQRLPGRSAEVVAPEAQMAEAEFYVQLEKLMLQIAKIYDEGT